MSTEDHKPTTIGEKIAAIKDRYRNLRRRKSSAQGPSIKPSPSKPWARRNIGSIKHASAIGGGERHHPSVKHRSTSKHNHRSKRNTYHWKKLYPLDPFRPRKRDRQNGHHAKHRAFKLRFNLA